MDRSRRQCWLVWVWALFGLALASPARLRAQQFDATNLHEPTPLATGWLIHGGDDPAYARPDFDDSKWTPVDTKMQSPRDVLDGQHPQIIWYRLHLKVPTTESGLALEEVRLANAFEIYANGKVLLRTGSLEPYSPSTYAAGLVRSIPAADISSGTLVLAVRLYISKSDWSGTFPGLYLQQPRARAGA